MTALKLYAGVRSLLPTLNYQPTLSRGYSQGYKVQFGKLTGLSYNKGPRKVEAHQIPRPNLPPEGDQYEPAKLHLVVKIRDLSGEEWRVKNLMDRLGMGHRGIGSRWAIVKNTPSMNDRLWRVKHLVRVYPITFPHGLPEDGDYSNCQLRPNGQLVVTKNIKLPDDINQIDPYIEKTKLNVPDIRIDARRRWDNLLGQGNKKYFEYKYNKVRD